MGPLWVPAALWPRFNCELNLTAATGRAGRFIGAVPHTFGNYNVIPKGQPRHTRSQVSFLAFYPPNGVFGRFFSTSILSRLNLGALCARRLWRWSQTKMSVVPKKQAPAFSGDTAGSKFGAPILWGFEYICYIARTSAAWSLLWHCAMRIQFLCVSHSASKSGRFSHTHTHTYIYIYYIS